MAAPRRWCFRKKLSKLLSLCSVERLSFVRESRVVLGEGEFLELEMEVGEAEAEAIA